MFRCYFLLLNNSNTSIEKKHLAISSFYPCPVCFTSKIKRTTFNNPAFWTEYPSCFSIPLLPKQDSLFYIPAYLNFTSWFGCMFHLTSHRAKPTNKKRAWFNCHSLFLFCFVLCRWLMLIFAFLPKTVFQRTDYQHFLLVIMEKQSNGNKMKNTWLKGEATPSDSGKKRGLLYISSPPLSCTAKQV